MHNAPSENPIDITGKYEYTAHTVLRIGGVLFTLSMGVSLLIAVPVLLFVAALALKSVALGGLWLLSVVVLAIFENRIIP